MSINMTARHKALLGKKWWRAFDNQTLTVISWDDYKKDKGNIDPLIKLNEQIPCRGNHGLVSYWAIGNKYEGVVSWVADYDEKNAPVGPPEPPHIANTTPVEKLMAFTLKEMTDNIEKVLTAYGPKGNKINCVKEIRAVTGLGLKDAIDMFKRAIEPTPKKVNLRNHFSEGNTYRVPSKTKESFIVRSVSENYIEALWITDANGKVLEKSYVHTYNIPDLRGFGFKFD